MVIHLVILKFSWLKNIYDLNSSTRLKNIKIHETELKWTSQTLYRASILMEIYLNEVQWDKDLSDFPSVQL